jgi:hypothetical protein
MKQTLFRIGSYLMVIFAVAHFVQMRNGIYIPNMTPDAKQMLDLMKNFEIEVGFGTTRTMWQLVSGFVLSWGLFVFVIGFIDLWVVRFERYNTTLLDRVAMTNFIGLAFSVTIGILFFTPPEVIFGSVVALCFLLSAMSPTTRL